MKRRAARAVGVAPAALRSGLGPDSSQTDSVKALRVKALTILSSAAKQNLIFYRRPTDVACEEARRGHYRARSARPTERRSHEAFPEAHRAAQPRGLQCRHAHLRLLWVEYGLNTAFVDAARALGGELARRGIGIVYGGGNVGLMGVLADAALAAGGEVIGVIPHSLVARELAHDRLTSLHVVNSMHERKALMASLSDAFIALPGGFGTLEESASR